MKTRGLKRPTLGISYLAGNHFYFLLTPWSESVHSYFFFLKAKSGEVSLNGSSEPDISSSCSVAFY